MLYLISILGIISLFLSCCSFLMARDPKRWRAWWMTRMGIHDLNFTREQKQEQVVRLKVIAYCALLVMIASSAFCAWWVVDELHEMRNKSPYEQIKEKTLKEVEKYKGKFNKLR